MSRAVGGGAASIRGFLVRPSVIPTGAVMKKLIHRICTAENGCPAATLNRLAIRNVST